jgi:hypothetical protein
MSKLAPYAKAIVAILGAGITAALGIWGPDTKVGMVLTILAAMITAASVYAVPNTPADTPRHAAEDSPL